MTEKKTEPHDVVCIGLAELDSGKLSAKFMEVVDGKIVGDKPISWLKVKGDPGNVYRIYSEPGEWTAEQKRAFIPSNGKLEWVSKWPNFEECTQWRAEARTLQALHERDRAARNAAKHSELDELIAPLARIYKRLPWSQKSAFLIVVHERIVSQTRSMLSADDDK
jgi:hypothetical protein